MKQLGHDEHGGTIVVLTEAEHNAFIRLKKAVEGRGLREQWDGRRYEGDETALDYAATLDAIYFWISAKVQANDLRILADSLDAALKIAKEA